MLEMEHIVYVYKDPRLSFFIVKRTPFSYQIPIFDKDGYETIEILQGQSMSCPLWTDIVISDRYVFAKAFDKLYEISDLQTK